MSDSTRSGDVVDECAAGAAELVVEADAGGEGEEALDDAFSEALEGAGAVAFEGEQVFAGREDRLDPLPDRREVGAVSGFVLAPRTHERGVEVADGLREGAAGVALVAERRLTPAAVAACEQFESDLAFVAFWRGERQCSGGAVERDQCVQPETPEVAGVGRAPTVVGGVCELRAFDRLAAAGALDRGRGDQEQIVGVAWALAREHRHQPLELVGQPAATLEVPRLGRKLREQVDKPPPRGLEEETVARYRHDRLSDTERDDLRVCDHPPGVPCRFRQEIVSSAINDRAESVEVGVHRGLLVDGDFSTADFDLSATNPSNTATAVESLI